MRPELLKQGQVYAGSTPETKLLILNNLPSWDQ
jgi:hypothetical protein